MSDDEKFVLIVSVILGFWLWLSWFAQHASVGPRGYSRPRQSLPFVAPLICASILFVILKTAASFDVRDSGTYLGFYMMFGAAWVAIAIRGAALLGISARDDVIERRNGAAAIALTGAMVGITFAFAGGNVGDGPGWWVVLFSAALATAALFALWFLLEVLAHVADAITVDRDSASALRLAGFLIAQGVILGRSVAGDWVSAADTVREMAVMAWPALVLLAMAALVERSFRPSAERLHPPMTSHGFYPAAAYIVAALAWVMSLQFTR